MLLLTRLAMLVARLRSLAQGLLRRRHVERHMDEEFRHHVSLRTEDLIRRGVPPAEAARQARLEFGHPERHKEAGRAARGLGSVDELRFSTLDVKLGVRMVGKHPLLSLVSVVGMAVAIGIGAGFFGFLDSMLNPTLPLAGGERIVAIQNVDVRDGGDDRRQIYDFSQWRGRLESVEDVAAFTNEQRNLAVPGRATALVAVAPMTPSGFRVAGVAPLLGRPLLDEDEAFGAPAVVVIGEEEWRRHFDGNPGILGREVRLGAVPHTVVGVMPTDFRFPVNHGFWVPLRLDPEAHEPGTGPSIYVFGRLADGATMASAQAELDAVGGAMAAALPASHEYLRPQVLPFAYPIVGIDTLAMGTFFRGVQVGISLLLVVIFVNVAILVYARTATRTGEIVVRAALGATRRRVVAQLFTESLVLSLLAAAVGLAAAGAGFEFLNAFWESDGDMPFWVTFGVSGKLVAYALGMALLAGVVVGVIPGLKATGRNLQSGLREASARGAQMQLGRTWTTLVVVQVALVVALLPSALFMVRGTAAGALKEPRFQADQVLVGRLSIEREKAPPAAVADAYQAAVREQFRTKTAALLEALRSEPTFQDAVLSLYIPGFDPGYRYEVEASGLVGQSQRNAVSPGLFDAYGVPVQGGRVFVPQDTVAGANVVVVDEVFARDLLEALNPLEQRVRRVTYQDGQPVHGPWLEVVGVVSDFTSQADFAGDDASLYEPLRLGEFDGYAGSLVLSVRTRGGATPGHTQRLRDLAFGVDPALQLMDLSTGAAVEERRRRAQLAMAFIVVAGTAAVLLLSVAGIYALMAFTVARRRREISIRAALGAAPRQLVGQVFGRTAWQLGAGAAIGVVAAVALDRFVIGGPLSAGGAVVIPATVAVLLGVALVASFRPIRQGLAVRPAEALNEE